MYPVKPQGNAILAFDLSGPRLALSLPKQENPGAPGLFAGSSSCCIITPYDIVCRSQINFLSAFHFAGYGFTIIS
jgi:hypothetical protein